MCCNVLTSASTPLPAGNEIFTATQAQKSFLLVCPSSQGDYVRLHWLFPDTKNYSKIKLVYHYDRWRGFTSKHSNKLQLAGPPYNPQAGSFSFLLTPDLKDGGLYVCEVSLNDVVFSQRTRLSVLKGKEESGWKLLRKGRGHRGGWNLIGHPAWPRPPELSISLFIAHCT